MINQILQSINTSFFNTNKPQKKENGIHEGISSLLEKPTEKERAEELKAIGKKTLHLHRWPEVNWRQFALMHNSSIIRYTTLEGGQTKTSLKSWSDLLDLWKKGEGLFFKAKSLTSSLIDKICFFLEDMQSYERFFPSLLYTFNDQPISQKELEDLSSDLLKEIETKLKSQKSTYLPFGYRHGVGNEGHSIPCKITRDGKDIIVTLLNLGNGCEPHALLDVTSTQSKVSFRYFPIRIPESLFFGKMGHAAFCHLLRYERDPPDPELHPYEGKDIYDIFMTLGEVEADLGDNPDLLKAKAQISGTCPEKGVKNMVHDILIDENIAAEDIKLIFLNVYTGSLIAGFHTFQKEPTELGRTLLRNGAEELGLTLLKLKHLITEEELLIGSSIVHEILEESSQPVVSPPPPISVSPPVTHFEKDFPQVDISKALKPFPQNANAVDVKKAPPPSTVFDRQNFSKQIKEWAEALTQLSSNEAFQFFQRCTLSLPIPEWKKESVWDEIPVNEIEGILKQFETFLFQGLRESSLSKKHLENQPLFFDQILSLHTVYAIADNLARRSGHTKLSGFASPFFPDQFNIQPNNFTSLPFGDENKRYHEVVNYFRSSKKEASGGVIFPIAPTLSVQQFLEDRSRGVVSQGSSHIHFLQQFFTFEQSNLVLIEPSLKIWKGEGGSLPKEVQSLYYIAFLSHLLFYGEDFSFPEKLEFSEEVDDSGKKALMIETYNQNFFARHGEKTGDGFQEPQFEEFEAGQQDFIPLFDGKIKNYQTNDSVCARLKDNEANSWHISEHLYRNLLRITRHPSLSLLMGIQWASENLYQLEHPGVQKILNTSFFSPGILPDRIEKEPTVIQTFRDFIQKGLNFYNGNAHHLSAILFLLRSGLFFETHVTHLFGEKESQGVLNHYLTTLNELLKLESDDETKLREIELHWLFAAAQIDYETPEEWAHFLAKFSAFQFGNSWYSVNYNWLPKKLKQKKLHLKNLEKRVRDPLFLNAVCEALLQNFEIEKEKSEGEGWVGTFPHYTSGKWKIDLSHGTVYYEGKGRLAKESEIFRDLSRFKVLEGTKEKHGKTYWKKAAVAGGAVSEAVSETFNEAVSLDGKLRVHQTANETLIEREIEFQGKSIRCRLFEFPVLPIDKLGLDFLNHINLVPIVHYVPLVKEKGLPEVITFDKEKDRPFFRIDYDQNQKAQITRLDEWGYSLPIKMASLKEVQESDPLYQKTLRFFPANETLCFINEKTHEIEELNFFQAKLKFKRKEGRLESVQFPGFEFLAHETLKELNHFKGALVLQNGEGKRKIILPAKKLKISSEVFSKEVLAGKEFVQSDPYFIFDVESDSSLKTREKKAYLYLAQLLKMQRDYEGAAKYLDRFKTGEFLEYKDFKLLEKFTQLTDRSPEALAFDVKLFYLIVDNMNLMLEKCFGDDRKWERWLFNPHLKWGLKIYLAYLRTMSSEKLTAIPKDLRLTDYQEKALLLALKSFFESHQEELPKPILVRLNLFSKKREAETEIREYDHSLRPKTFEKLLPPGELKVLALSHKTKKFPLGENRKTMGETWENFSTLDYPNRFRRESVQAHFPELFEEAKKCPKNSPDPFDFKLLSLLKMQNRAENSKFPAARDLGFLLFYVRHFSDRFQDLSFQKLSSEREAIETFNEIVDRVSKLNEDPEYLTFKKSYLEKRAPFHFSKKILLQFPKDEPASFSILEKKTSYLETPLRSFAQSLFEKKVDPLSLPDQPPFKDEALSFDPETLQGDLFKQLTDGYKLLKLKKKVSYRLREENLSKTKKDLEQRKKELSQNVQTKKAELVEKANAGYQIHKGKLQKKELLNEVEFRLSQESQQNLKLTPEIIMKEAVLKNDPSFLIKNCPLATEKDIQELMKEVSLFYHEEALLKMCEDACHLMEKLEKNPADVEKQEELAQLLDYKFHYDPLKYPEIAYFKVTAGKHPREEQAKIYTWICDGFAKKENRLFQLPAGAGKTSYLIPLMMLRAKREKLMPVVFSTQAIYPVDKDNLSRTLADLAEKISFLEVGLHMKISEEELMFIHNQLRLYHMEGRGLILTPQIFYALKLMHTYTALKDESKMTKKEIKEKENQVYWLGRILNFFETNCLLIMDESHRNLDSLTRSIYGMEDFSFLPEHEQALFLTMMKPLLGQEKVYTKDLKDLSEIARMKENLLGAPTDEEIKIIQETLAEYMSKQPLFEMLDEKDQKSFVYYWTHKKAAQPPLLKKWAAEDKKKADLAALTGYFILDLLPQIIKMRTELDHTPSIFQEEEFDTPCHHKSPSTAQFEDPYSAVSLSIKGTYHRHLTEKQVRKLIEKLLETDWREQSHLDSNEETQSALHFKSWVENSPLKELHLRDVSLSNPKQMEKLIACLSENPLAIEHYLTKIILPQIGYSTEQLVATPAHLMNFALSILFSATPLHPSLYPEGIKETRLDPVFEAEVVTEYCKEKNQSYLFPESCAQFFEEMKKGNELSNKATVFLDPGGFFCDIANEEVAKKWLANSHLDGVLYFKEGKNLNVDKDEKICLMMRDHKIYEFKGSEIKEGFAKEKLDWEKLKIGTFYDAAHTESTNIAQKPNTHALLFVGDRLTSSRAIQAIMRLRGFLDEGQKQTISWVIQRDLAKKIPLGKSKIVSGSALTSWMIRNEAEESKKKAILAAFQNIDFEIEDPAAHEIRKNLEDPREVIHLLNKYKKGFVEKVKHDPYKSFGEHESKGDTDKVLWSYARERYQKFGYSIPFEENSLLEEKLQKIINKLNKKIKKIPSRFQEKISKKIEQHCKLKRKTDTEEIQFCPRRFDPISAEGVYGKLSIDDPKYPWAKKMVKSRDIFETKGLTENLYFLENQLLTAKNGGTSLGSSYLKPIDFFLIIIHDGKIWAEADSNEILATNIETLGVCQDDPDIQHKVFLVTSDGKLCQKGKGALEPSEEELKKILNSAWLRDLTIDAALLKGQVCHLDRLEERLKGWPDFEAFWKKVLEALPNPESANHTAISKLFKKLKIGKKVDIQRENV